MRKILLILICFCGIQAFAKSYVTLTITRQNDTIVYQKDTNISEKRAFKEDLKDKYSDKDFQYKEYEEKKVSSSSAVNSDFVKALGYFMTSIFPFLLGGFVVFLILKTVLGLQFNFRKIRTSNKNLVSTKLVEDEDINELDINALLAKAIEEKNFRLAIRYYYLSSLKKLAAHKVIDYHKDKTNSEYLFEIKNKEVRMEFSYLSYIYSYVWYGEFTVDEQRFHHAATKYQSFLKSISS